MEYAVEFSVVRAVWVWMRFAHESKFALASFSTSVSLYYVDKLR